MKSLYFPINNKSALVQVTAWHRTGDKPSSEQMLTSSLMHICGTSGRWVELMNRIFTYEFCCIYCEYASSTQVCCTTETRSWWYHWTHTSLASYVHWSYFQRCVQYGPQRPNCWPFLDPKVSQNPGLWSLSQKVSTGFTTVLLHVLIASIFSGVWNKGPTGKIMGPFWPPNELKLRWLVIFSKSFHWFLISMVHMHIASIF